MGTNSTNDVVDQTADPPAGVYLEAGPECKDVQGMHRREGPAVVIQLVLGLLELRPNRLLGVRLGALSPCLMNTVLGGSGVSLGHLVRYVFPPIVGRRPHLGTNR